MCWNIEITTYKGFDIVYQCDVRGADYGETVKVDTGDTVRDNVTGKLVAEEWEFDTVDEAKQYIDDLENEMEARAESERNYRHTYTSLCAGYWA